MNEITARNKYSITDAKRAANQKAIKEFSILDVNKRYINSYRDSRYPHWETEEKQKNSWLQYKSTIGNFLEYCNKDIASVSEIDITGFISKFANQATRINKIAHIKSFLTYLMINNTENIASRTNINTLLLILKL
ncbi:hypothetical protein [Paenibacillus elgii]|uniref:hypothetical protein n=1 Tax=Paenibacillus elgii TaxID=189691 RepID=UPI002041EA95|nr:hypothetical protein [Paenibacillus elgii]MCM3273069.1 hypothetical protein [Paenibacillus elgii]